MQIATWSDGGGPRVMGRIEIDYEKLTKAIKDRNYSKGETVPSIVAMVAKGVSEGLFFIKKSVGRILLGNFIKSESMNVSISVRMENNNEWFVTLRDCHSKTMSQIQSDYEKAVKDLKDGKDPLYNFVKNLSEKYPSFVIQFVMMLVIFIISDVGVGIPFIGLKSFPFGMLFILDNSNTNTIDNYGILNPMFKTGIHMTLNKPTEKPVVNGDKIEIQRLMNVNVCFDHRYADGADGAKMIKKVYEYLDKIDEHLKE